MILEHLTVTDFRVFQGRHHFDLNPRKKWNKKQPIILFGGLNGSGKTSMLSAVRLALYGRQSLGIGISQKNYQDYLLKSINRPRDSILKTNKATIELTFSYSSMGIQSHYKVVRDWGVTNNKISESLSIYKDDERIDALNYDQCQGFLNELIPIGVSELFFFDGEKIAELAEDTTGGALSDAIKKLLGLDLIERLNADLGVLLRTQEKSKFSAKDKKELEKLEQELKKEEESANNSLQDYETYRTMVKAEEKNLEKYQNELNSRGGAWATSREDEISKQAQLVAERQVIENSLSEIFAGAYPLSLSLNMSKRVLKQLKDESKLKEFNTEIKAIESHYKKIKTKFNKVLNKPDYSSVNEILDKELDIKKDKAPNAELIHDLSNTSLLKIESDIEKAISVDSKKVNSLRKKLIAISKELDSIGLNIARAPDGATLNKLFDSIKSINNVINKQQAKMESSRETAKRHYRNAIELTRKISALHEKFVTEEDKSHSSKYIDNAKQLLSEFSVKAAEQKVSDLEAEFITSFRNLARKDDINLKAKIDPKTFKVTLVDGADNLVSKDELSAGEKQIYAISILEALARTSGRRLPIIIDTPLGRLDSKHRTNLIENYFPFASHQVIILSTDTEVDENYYSALNKHISHAFKLEYDSKSGSSSAKEGYFWRVTEAA
jgi:DNA sulfur modification protein DndD